MSTQEVAERQARWQIQGPAPAPQPGSRGRLILPSGAEFVVFQHASPVPANHWGCFISQIPSSTYVTAYLDEARDVLMTRMAEALQTAADELREYLSTER